MATHLYASGLISAAQTMRGDEKIHVGIRPYELHAGNILAIVAYPQLLCEEFTKIHKRQPKFTIILSLNDWEQATLDGPDIYNYHFDIWPKDTTIQYQKEDTQKATALVWGGKIVKAVRSINELYPEVTVKPVYNSSLRSSKAMEHVIFKTIQNRKELKKLMAESAKKPTLDVDSQFATAVCPDCKNANTKTEVVHGKITLYCSPCKSTHTGAYQEFSYWLYHKPLFSARWKHFGFSHSISGGDHYQEGDMNTRQVLYEYLFDKPAPNLEMIFSPILIGNNGVKMSKSRSNYFYIEPEKVTQKARGHNEQMINLD